MRFPRQKCGVFEHRYLCSSQIGFAKLAAAMITPWNRPVIPAGRTVGSQRPLMIPATSNH
jgi:hypothetical protein